MHAKLLLSETLDLITGNVRAAQQKTISQTD